MADLFSLLSRAATGLQAHSGQSATASHNLANASTPGYARQRANLEAAAASRLGAQLLGQGVTLGAISQARSSFVEQQLPAALSASARSEAEAAALQGLSALTPEGPTGLAGALGGFYGALRQLGQAPGDLGARSAVVAAAQNAALAINRSAEGIARARDGLDTTLAANASQVTSLARSLADLNRQVRVERAAGGTPNDLLDARQRVQDELVQLSGATVVPNQNGDVTLTLPNGGPALVSGDFAATVTTQADPTNGMHLALTVSPPGGGAAAIAPRATWGGSMRGTLDARDGALLQAEQAIDTLAFDWASQANTAHAAGFGLDGGTGRALFTTTATAVGAGRALSVNAAVLADPRALATSATAAGVPGDATALFALLQTEATALSNGQSVFDGAAAAIAQYGSATVGAKSAAERDAAVAGQLVTLRESTSGVSIDEELIALTQSQRNYEAVLKVITTTNEMLKTLLDLR